MKKISIIISTILIQVLLLSTFLFAQDNMQHLSEKFVINRLGKGWIRDIEFSPDGETFAVATTIGVWIYDSHTQNVVNKIQGFMGGAYAISYSNDGKILAAAHDDHTIRLWNPKNTNQNGDRNVFRGHKGVIHDVTFSHDLRGSMVASASADNSIRLWNTHTTDNKKKLTAILPYNDVVRTIEFSSDNKMLAGGSDDGVIKVWDAGTGEIIFNFNQHKDSVQELRFSPNRTKLISVSLDRTAILWSLVGEGGIINAPVQQRETVYAVQYSPDGKTFATGSDDKLIRVWDADSVTEMYSLQGHNDSVYEIDYSPDGSSIVSGSPDGTVFMWDTLGKRERYVISGHTGGIKALVYTNDNRIRACGTGLDGKLRIWDAGTSSELSILRDHIELTQAVAFSNDGERIASGGSVDGNIFLSNVLKILNNNPDNDNSVQTVFNGNHHGITATAISPANTILASGGADGKIHLMNIQTARELKILRGANSTITALTFVVDSTRLFSGEEDGTIRFWNTLTGSEVEDGFIGAFSGVTALAYSQNIGILAVGDMFGQINLFDFFEKEKKSILTQHTKKITSIIFSKDNLTLVSGSEDGTILLWDLQEILNNVEEHDKNSGRAIIPKKTPKAESDNQQEQSAQEIARKALASTVYLQRHNANGDIIGHGSGFFISPDKIATNYHVIEGSTSVLARQIGKDNWQPIEEIILTDQRHDLAILKLSNIVSPVLPLADSDNVQIGETIFVIGNPEKLEGTFSKGIVSAIRPVGKVIMIQIDAPISPGSSGGAVLSNKGEVIGVATLTRIGRNAQNLNFAIPSNYLKALLEKAK